MAVKLGRVNVDAMLRELTAKQFMEWEAYARMEPFNELRDDFRAARICEVIWNVAVASKEHQRPIQDFLLKWKQVAEVNKKQTWEDKLAIAYAICASYSVDDAELKR